MQVQENFPLKSYNTFGVKANAPLFAAFSNMDELGGILREYTSTPLMVLGGGSNILFTQDFDGLVLKNEISGIHTVHEDEEHIYVKAGAGENWHRFVMHCIDHELAGVENLSLIPGNVGAAPMQNIGAYGVELKDIFHSLEAFHIRDRRLVNFSLNDCAFGYRDSVFKNKYRDQFIILSVTFRLNRHANPDTSYGAILDELKKMNAMPTIHSVSQAVINIRTAKLPDPAVTGNAGSFFKNPEISEMVFTSLVDRFPGIIGYHLPSGKVKLAAGWMIEECGWKGFRRGDAGCHPRQALVLVNYGNASGREILALGEEIQASVLEKFGVALEREVNVI